jgi:hypothetical protein
MKRLALLVLVACACPSKKPARQGGPGTATTPVATVTTCDAVRPRVEQLYRAEAQAKEPKRVEEAVADNTQMVMNDCAKDPAKIVPCLAKAATVSELEKDCLIPLDDEGTEGQ